MMADHDELVAEMPVLETMGTQERQKLAKKRRLQQLKRWSQREKEWIAKEKQLNKRLANIMSEENNGLNLKQYTTYNSNQRTKKKLIDNATTSNSNTKQNSLSQPDPETDGISNEFNNNNTIDGPYSNSLQPNGRVHFNVGVMLLEAAARNDYDEVKRLLMLGVSPDSVNHDGLTALHQCCIDASDPIMQLLLDYGANVDARDAEHWTPLHAACTCGHLNLVKILVEHGADLLAINGDGNMPFDVCEDEATLDFIESEMVKQDITQEMIDLTRASTEMNMLTELEKLVSSKTDLNEADDHGVTWLHIAATNNYLSSVKFLLNHGVNVNVCDKDQWQPLHGVACWGNEQHIKVAELLVEAGANLDAKTLNDETVFDLCDNVDLMERLNQLKDEIESKQVTGTGRLRRTQSRTNSRVHSVRRTSVRDKNQISRREAREEALLRVDSNTDPTVAVISSKMAVVNNDNHHTELAKSDDNLTNGDNHSTGCDDAKLEQTNRLQPKVTNLDEQNNAEQGPSITILNGNLMTEARHDGVLVTESSKLKEASNESHNSMFQQDTGICSMSKQSVAAQSSKQLAISSDVKVNLQHQPQDTVSTDQHQACDPTTILANSQKKISATTVQVQFVPTNYTLSNLKKHRSDLRMRFRSINDGVSTISLNSIDRSLAQNYDNAYDVTHELPAPVVSIKETVRFEPKSELQNRSGLTKHVVNGVGFRPESPNSTYRKFHGEPSEVIGDDSGRKLRNKCCNVI